MEHEISNIAHLKTDCYEKGENEKEEGLIIAPQQDFFQGVEDAVIHGAFCVIIIIREDNFAGINVPETGKLKTPALVAVDVDGIALFVPVERPITTWALQARERGQQVWHGEDHVFITAE